MKRFTLFLFFLLLCTLPAPVSAQNRYSTGTHSSGNRMIRAEDRPSARANRSHYWSERRESTVTAVQINETTTCIFNKDKSFLYFGEAVPAKEDRDAYPSGRGLARYRVSAPENGSAPYEYCLCPWKRGSRHGEGLMKRADGTYAKVRWKWDKIKSVRQDPPTEDEIRSLEDSIATLTALLDVL